MRDSDKNLLIEIYGAIDALYWMPIARPKRNLACWEAAYCTDGLNFATDRNSAEALRRLASENYLTAKGSTSGRSFKLTEQGIFTAAALYGVDLDDCRQSLEYVSKQKSKYTHPVNSHNIVMGYQLIDSAGAWWKTANASRENWETYQADLFRAEFTVMPLLMLQWLWRYTSSDGRLWAVRVTDKGKDALKNWRSYSLPEPLDDEQEAHDRGFRAGLNRFERQPPAKFQNYIPAYIPASQWM